MNVALQESDFNQFIRLVLGRPITHYLEDNKEFPDMLGSRPAKQCFSTVLTKVLQLEIHKYKKQGILYIENDVVGQFDRIIIPLVLLFLQQLDIID